MKKAINASEVRDAPEVIIGTIRSCIDPAKNSIAQLKLLCALSEESISPSSCGTLSMEKNASMSFND